MEVIYLLNTSSEMTPYHLNQIKTFIINSLKMYQLSGEKVRLSFARFPEIKKGASLASARYQYFENAEEVAKLINDESRTNQQRGGDVVATDKNLNQLLRKIFEDLGSDIGTGTGSGSSTVSPSKRVFVFFIHESENRLDNLDLQLLEENLDELKTRNFHPIFVYFGRKNLDGLQRVVGNPNQVIQVADFGGANSNEIGLLEREIGESGRKRFIFCFFIFMRTSQLCLTIISIFFLLWWSIL